MASYKISISEQQRAIIQRALALYLMGHDPRELPADDKQVSQDLHSMFQTLPHDEAEQVARYGHAPGTTLHGFCV